MRINAILYLAGRFLLIIGACLFIPAFVSLYYGETETAKHFFGTSGVTFVVAALGIYLHRKSKDEPIKARDGFLLVTLLWVLASFVGSIPFYLSPYFTSFVDAFFESTSGFTTTGASILTDIEVLPHGLLLWRDFTHWIGGMGIIVLAIAILPQLSIGGMQIMKNETPGPTLEQLKPRIKQTALSLWKVYLIFSALLVVILWSLGMPLFESFCHMFGTMGTGGFSTKNASIAHYSTAIQMVISLFMLIAGINFVLHYRWLHGKVMPIFKDSEWRFFMGLILVSVTLIVFDLKFKADISIREAIRLSIFQVLAVTSTTGYATANYDLWPHFSKGLLFLLMVVGGCAGSTGGGMKQVRLLLLFKRAKQSIVQHIYPKAIVNVKLNKKVVSESILNGVSNFFLVYIVIFSFCTLTLLLYDIDFVTATSAVIACISNIGPGFERVGAVQNYAFFPPVLKYVLCLCMVVGRLEIFTVLVLFFPDTWKR